MKLKLNPNKIRCRNIFRIIYAGMEKYPYVPKNSVPRYPPKNPQDYHRVIFEQYLVRDWTPFP